MRIALCDDDREFLSKLNDMIHEFAKENRIAVTTDLFFSGEDLPMQARDLYDIIFMDIYLSSDETDPNGLVC